MDFLGTLTFLHLLNLSIKFHLNNYLELRKLFLQHFKISLNKCFVITFILLSLGL